MWKRRKDLLDKFSVFPRNISLKEAMLKCFSSRTGEDTEECDCCPFRFTCYTQKAEVTVIDYEESEQEFFRRLNAELKSVGTSSNGKDFRLST